MQDIYNDDMFEELGHIAPHSPETETALLGSIILDNEVMHEISQKINVDDFYIKRNQRIYEAMLELYSEGANIEYYLLNELLNSKHKNEEDYGGIEYLSGLPNKISYTPSMSEYVKILKKHSQKRSLIRMSRQIIEQCYDTTKMSKDIVEFSQKEVFDLIQTNITKEPATAKEVMREVLDDFKNKIKNTEDMLGIPSAIESLDTLTRGFRNGNLITIGGRPSMGKTSLGVNIMVNVAVNHDMPVLFFSGEMEKFDIGQNAIAAHAKTNLTDIMTGVIKDHEESIVSAAMIELSKTPIFIDDDELNITRIKAVTRKYIMLHDIKLIIIDYLQLMMHERVNKTSTEAEAISETVKQLKMLAKECNIPVIVLAQINRQSANKQGKVAVYKPTMNELKGSGGIEEHSDVVILIHREYYYTQKAEDIGNDYLIVAKNRRGQTGEAAVTFVPHQVRFESRTAADGEYYNTIITRR